MLLELLININLTCKYSFVFIIHVISGEFIYKLIPIVMFLSIQYPKLRNNEFVQFFKLLVEIINSNDPEVLKIKSQFDELADLLASLNVIFKPESGSAITRELQEIDARRDAAITGIEMQIKSLSYYFESEKKIAAQILSNSLSAYGSSISRMNYQAETSTITSIIQKWEGDNRLISCLEILNLTKWVLELKIANNLFEERYIARLKEAAEEPEQNTIDLRKQIIKSYRKLTAHLQSHATLSGNDSYEAVVQQINQLIEQYNKLVASRGNSKEEEALN